MVDKKITALSAITSASAADLLPIVQNVATTPVTRKATVAQLKEFCFNALTAVGDILYATSASTPAKLDIGTTGQVISASTTGPVWVYPNDWIRAVGTWTYASSTTITVPSGADSIYNVGDKIRLKQGGGYKYFYITTVASTLLTVNGGSSYTVAASTITDNYYSNTPSPNGFPSAIGYTPSFSGTGVSIGDATVVGLFNITGKWLDFALKVTYGSTTNFGSGNLSVSLPVNTSSASALDYLGTCHLRDAGTNNYERTVQINSSSSAIQYFNQQDSATNVSNINASVPFTWVASDTLGLEVRYMI